MTDITTNVSSAAVVAPSTVTDAVSAPSDAKRKRQLIEADLLPENVRIAASKLAAYAKVKAEHDANLKASAKQTLGDTSEESLKETIKSFCRENRDVQDIRAGSTIVKAILSKSCQSNLNEASVMKLVSRSVDMTSTMRREKQIQRLHENHTLTKEDAEIIVDEMNGIDSIELLKCVNNEMQKMKTTTERYAISFDVKQSSV